MIVSAFFWAARLPFEVAAPTIISMTRIRAAISPKRERSFRVPLFVRVELIFGRSPGQGPFLSHKCEMRAVRQARADDNIVISMLPAYAELRSNLLVPFGRHRPCQTTPSSAAPAKTVVGP